MLEFLPKDVSEGLRAAQLNKAKRRSRLRVRVGGGRHHNGRVTDLPRRAITRAAAAIGETMP